MGVNLSDLITSKSIEISYLNGKTIAIDAFNTIYQFLSIIRDRFTGEPLKDSKGNVTSHLSGLIYRTSRMLEAGINPVFIFDGKPPEFKQRTVEERMLIRAEAEAKWKEAVKEGDVEKIRKHSQGASRLTADMIEDSKKLLSNMGVSWLQAPSEGEAQASYMCNKGQVWAAGSQDWDSLLFGTKRLVRNLTVTGKRKLPGKQVYVDVKPELIDLDVVLKSNGLTREQLVIIGILVGTDYNPGGIKGIGPKKAFKRVKDEKELEKVIAKVKWEFDIEPKKILDFFLEPPARDMEIRKEKLNPEALKTQLVDKHEFGEERINKVIEKLSKGKKGQTGLGSFMG